MKISEMITDRYKLRIPPTVYYELLADVVEVEEEQEPILDKVRTEIEQKLGKHGNISLYNRAIYDVLQILNKYREVEE